MTAGDWWSLVVLGGSTAITVVLGVRLHAKDQALAQRQREDDRQLMRELRDK